MAGASKPLEDVGLRPFTDIVLLFRSFGSALREPEVKGALTIALTLVTFATLFYWHFEEWSLLDAFYFSIVTIATVGYGDLAPKTVIGKIFTIGYIFCGIGIFVAAVTAFAQATLRADQRRRD